MKTNIEKPNMVRILPMDKKFEFRDWPIEKVQREFFLDDLPYCLVPVSSQFIFPIQS